MRVRRQTLSGRFVRKPSSGNKTADPAGTWTKVWSQWREHLGCPGLATLGPLPVPLECEGHRKETIETLRLRGKFLLEIREREQPEASDVTASRERVGWEREKWWGEKTGSSWGCGSKGSKRRESLPVMLRQEGAG